MQFVIIAQHEDGGPTKREVRAHGPFTERAQADAYIARHKLKNYWWVDLIDLDEGRKE